MQKLVSSWDPTEGSRSLDGWLRRWHLGSESSGYWERTEASGSSWHWPADIPLASLSREKKEKICIEETAAYKK